MLQRCQVRVGYTLNNGGVLRIEPPLTAGWEECTRFLDALAFTVSKLANGNTAELTAHISGYQEADTFTELPVARKPPKVERHPQDSRFAFVLHPLTLRNYVDADHTLSPLSDEEINRLSQGLADNFDPFVIGEARVVSDTGKSAYGEFILVPRTASELITMPAAEAIDEIKAACELAQTRGAQVLGLGAYSSIVTFGGLSLQDLNGLAITTGNGYTAAISVEHIYHAVQKGGSDLGDKTVAVVGASGSIGRAVAILLAERSGPMTLIGNGQNAANNYSRLRNVIASILQRWWSLQKNDYSFSKGSLADGLSAMLPSTNAVWRAQQWRTLADRVITSGRYFKITCNVTGSVLDADIVVTATSNTTYLLKDEHLKPGAIVCDISRPSNLQRKANGNSDITILDGGIVKAPENMNMTFDLDIPSGHVYACMAETMVLALENCHDAASIGLDIDIDRALKLQDCAYKHGFRHA
jgi:predicted amino acid dehydrogenase